MANASPVDMIHLAYVDCSNLFIEGQKVSAIALGMAHNLHDAKQRGVIDFDYRLGLYRLMDLLVRAEGPTRAVVFGGVTDTNQGLWRHAVNAGFEVVAVERGFSGKEKWVDTSVVTRMCRDAYRFGDPRQDWITLVAGDGDYEPTLRQLWGTASPSRCCTGRMPAGSYGRRRRSSRARPLHCGSIASVSGADPPRACLRGLGLYRCVSWLSRERLRVSNLRLCSSKAVGYGRRISGADAAGFKAE